MGVPLAEMARVVEYEGDDFVYIQLLDGNGGIIAAIAFDDDQFQNFSNVLITAQQKRAGDDARDLMDDCQGEG